MDHRGISDAVIGIFGHGKISLDLVKMLMALNARRINIFSPAPPKHVAQIISNSLKLNSCPDSVVVTDNPKAVFKNSDVVVVLLPDSTKPYHGVVTHRLVNSRLLNHCKQGMHLVLCGASGTWVEQDIVFALFNLVRSVELHVTYMTRM